MKDYCWHRLQLRKQPSCSWRLWKSVILIPSVLAALLTGNASSSCKQNIPLSSSPIVISEQKRKELFLAIRKGTTCPSLPPTAALSIAAKSVAAKQPRFNSYGKNDFAVGCSSAGSCNKAPVAQLTSPRALSHQSRSRLALKKDDFSTTTVRTAHAVRPAAQRKSALIVKSAKSSKGKYRYLTPTVRQAIDQAPIRKGRWRYIIVHNSGTERGNARAFDAYHRRVRRMKNGLAYHFVIGNGRLSRNGEIEVGDRWRKQINGGHVASDHLNNIAIGICLVGDFNRHAPTLQQLAAFEELVSCLQARVGRSRRRRVMVLGHLEMNSRPTDCPGRRFSLHRLHRRFPSK